MEHDLDTTLDRPGAWMQTNSGKKFYPEDPRPEDICMNDIANGLALDIRYGGQGDIYKPLTVAEHSTHMARHVMRETWADDQLMYRVAFLALLHDAPEAYLNDLTRPVKKAVGEAYYSLEAKLEEVIFVKYDLLDTHARWAAYIKELDIRIIPLEKAAVHPRAQAWLSDHQDPLPHVYIQCWSAPDAKGHFLATYDNICKGLKIKPEEYHI